MPVTADLRVVCTGTQSAQLDLGAATFPFSLSAELSLASGIGVGMVDRVFADTRTLTASSSETLDLAASLVDAFGATITMVTIKAVIVKANPANTNDVLFTRGATLGVPLFTAVSSGIGVRPGGAFAWFCGGAGVGVVAGTADLLTFTNGAGGTPVTYDVIVLGTSA